MHSFKHGGETATFNSLSHQLGLVSPPPAKRLIPRHTLGQRETKEDQAKKERYLAYLKQWQASSSVVDNHAYVIRKNILYTSPLRLIGHRVGYALQSIEHKICGLQFINEQGEKRLYGEKKGAFAVLGKLDSADILYLCEGYATGNAIYHLALQKNPYAVIVGVDAGNMVLVAKLLKQKYPLKKLIICADNDAETLAKGKGNPGLIQAYEAAIQNYCEIKIPSAEFGSDWCDFWQGNSEKTISAFQQKNPIRLQGYAVAQLQQFKPDAQGLFFKKALFRTFKFLVNEYPHKHDDKSILDLIFSACQHTGIELKELHDIWSRVKRRRFGMALRAQSFSKQNKENVTVMECASITDIAKHIQELKLKHPRAVFATNAPMGSGKTQTLMQPEFIWAESAMMLPLVITPVRSLTQGVAERFSSFHYQNDLELMRNKDHLPSSLAITINSIINPNYQHCLDYCRALFIDEYTQVLRAITLGTVENHLRQVTENKLAKLMQQANYVYIADADLNQIALDHIQATISKETPIFVFTLAKAKLMKAVNSVITDNNSPHSKQAPTQIIYRCHQFKSEKLAPTALLKQIIKGLDDNKKIYVATDSKKQADKIELALKKKNNINLLSVTADSVNFPQTKAFLDAPDEYLKLNQPNVVIVSPAVQSGISIESNYFNEVFGIYTGTVTPVVFQQMLHRIRTQTIFNLILPAQRNASTYELENPTTLLMAAYQQHIKQFGEKQSFFDAKTGITHIGNLKIKEEDSKVIIEGDPLYERFEKLSAHLQALENQQRHYAPQFLLLQAKARGIKLEFIHHDVNELDKLILKINHDNLNEASELNRKIALCGTDELTDEAYQLLQIKGAKTEDGVNALKRHEMAKELHLEEIKNEDIEFFDNGGVKALKNYQALCNGTTHANSLDEEDKRKGIAKVNARWRKCKVNLLNLLFTELEINSETGKGFYEKTKAKKCRELLIQDEELSRYILFKLKLKTTNHLADTAFINKLFKKLLNLKIKRLQVREEEMRYWVYSLNQDSFKQLRYYYERNLTQENEQKLIICHQE